MKLENKCMLDTQCNKECMTIKIAKFARHNFLSVGSKIAILVFFFLHLFNDSREAGEAFRACVD
jgi:hypothetical protein